MKEYLTTKELCAKLKVGRTSLHRWRKNDDFPFKKIGAAVRFDLDEVEQWLKNK